MKEKEIFYLIEHQSKIDYSMPLRILEYQVAIIRSAIDKSKIKNKSYKIPLVIPIVLYTGKQKWNASKYLEEIQEKIKDQNIKIGNYCLVDINNYTEKELLEDDAFLSKMMLIEKSKNTEEIAKILEKIVIKIQKEDKKLLKRIIEMILEEKIGSAKTKEIIKKLEKESDYMLAVVDMIRKENQMYIDMGRKDGKKETIKEIVNKMLRKNLPEKTISEITGISQQEIEKLKKLNNK